MISTACNQCGRKTTGNRYVDKELCDSCYTALIERVVRKHIRLEGCIKKGAMILAIDDVTEYLLHRILNMPVEIIKKSSASLGLKQLGQVFSGTPLLNSAIEKDNIDVIVVPWTLDDETESFLEQILFKKKSINDSPKILKLLYPVSRKDVAAFCRIRNIKYKSPKNSDSLDFVEAMEQKYPGTKNALLKCSANIKDIVSEK
jgi:hypothetical protein